LGAAARTVKLVEMTVLVGEDEQKVLEHRRALRERSSGALEVVDAAQEPERLLGAVAAPGLFAPQRFVWVDGFDNVSDDQLRAVLAAPSRAVVVARSQSLTPSRRKLLKDQAVVLDVSAPKGKAAAGRVVEMIRTSGVVVDSAGRKLLVERTSHDLDRLASVLRQCTIMGLTNPNADALKVLVGSSAAPGVPWDLTDAIERGDLKGALASASGLEGPRAHGYLTSRFLNVLRLAEGGVRDVERAQELLGVKARFQAESLVALAARLGPERASAAVRLLADADRDVKVSRTGDEFEVLVAALCRLCAAPKR
jgi:DNA polymerase III delta subunit